MWMTIGLVAMGSCIMFLIGMLIYAAYKGDNTDLS